MSVHCEYDDTITVLLIHCALHSLALKPSFINEVIDGEHLNKGTLLIKLRAFRKKNSTMDIQGYRLGDMNVSEDLELS